MSPRTGPCGPLRRRRHREIDQDRRVRRGLLHLSSTVRNLVGIAGKPHARTIVACIGPKTAETAVEFGLRVDVQPETAAVGPLVEALAEHAARLRAEGALPPPRKKSRRR